MFWSIAAAISFLIWVYLVFAHGQFWLIKTAPVPSLRANRRVVVVVPARNEADVIAESLTSLFEQYFVAPLHIVLVDDNSTDGTADLARALAHELGREKDLTVILGSPVPAGWTGKLWALSQGTEEALKHHPDFLLFADADIRHDGRNVADLIARAEANQLDLASHIVRLSVKTFSEKMLIPAFVYYFLQLYPPKWIANPGDKTAGAAGGCILLRPSALARIGGHAAIRNEIIDDCSLARVVKSTGGKIWVGLTRTTFSIRPYDGFAEIGRMISRSAFNQLRHSSLILFEVLLGLTITYVIPVAALLSRQRAAAFLGLAAWLLMTLSYAPMIRFYRLPSLWAFALPPIALFYAGATVHSALQYWSGKGGVWKGRAQDA